ncbi:MAG: hypothetical protein E7A11_13285 [Clostridium sp.]|uniref:hypothetical protein n=1 Tax=Clostridium sp. TaxID=1506 RepID=UPI0029049D67|nr:hypothetical protein [Clostridium sp.]MDU1078084.1 hypothetical protein [Clostridium sp.]MDU1126246.1 hypothetical protein [Clostridium sp.]
MKKRLGYHLLCTYIFYVLLAVTFVWDYFYRDGEKLWRIGLIYVTIFAARVLFSKTFLRKSKGVYVVTLVFIFFAMYLANVMNFYAFEAYDKILHFASGILLAFYGLIYCVYLCGDQSNKSINPIILVAFPFLFSVACAGLWELWEFATDSIFGLTAQNGSLNDTMWDIICGTIGGIISCTFIYLHIKIKNIKFIQTIINEMK